MKKFKSIIIAGILALGLASCGNSGTEAKPSAETSAETGASGDAETSAEVSGDTETPADADGKSYLDEIKERGKIVLLTEATFPPYEYISSTGVNEVDGVDIEIGKIIAEKLGVELEVMDMNFDLLTESVNSGRGDFIAAGFTVTDERKEVVDFTNPYVQNSLLVILPADSTITTIEELADKKIAVQEATTGDFLATDNIANDENNVLRFKSAVEAAGTVSNGLADAVVLDELPALNAVENSNGKAKIMENFNEKEDTAMAVKKGNTELKELLDEVIAELEAEGKIQEFIDKHMAAATE